MDNFDENYDFAGWATRNDVRCSDGRVIRHDAFAEQDGKYVPLVWNHQHNDPDNIVGKALLHNCDEGVYAYGYFNDTESANVSKQLLKHGDITSLSIFANQLKHNGSNVVHGMIREVSLVLAGANPEAYIDSVMVHGDEAYADEGTIFMNSPLELSHADTAKDTKTESKSEDSKTDDSKPDDSKPKDEANPKNSDDETVADIVNSMTDKQKAVVFYVIGEALKSKGIDPESVGAKAPEATVSHAGTEPDKPASDDSESDETIGDVIDSLNEKQKNVMYYIIGQYIKDNDIDESDATDDTKEDDTMSHNVFDQDSDPNAFAEDSLMHGLDCSINNVITDMRNHGGSLKNSFAAHGLDVDNLNMSDYLEHASYGITNIDTMFPDAKAVANQPFMLTRDQAWVPTVMSRVGHTPFARVKSIVANLTEDDARAKGYIKGKMKKEEFFALSKRITTPTTIYKKQKLDRDDLVDITDFDVIVWLKAEMRQMLDAEIARAILIGDGRTPGTDDKINETCLRPIMTDDSFYTIKATMKFESEPDRDTFADEFITTAVSSREDYRGSGNPTMFLSEAVLTKLLLQKDKIGHRLYKTKDELAAALLVSDIVTVPEMKGIKRTPAAGETTLTGKTPEVDALIVNLADYNVGMDRGGAVNMFDDFDIDYNQEKYLIETRISGALVVPYSAIVIEHLIGD